MPTFILVALEALKHIKIIFFHIGISIFILVALETLKHIKIMFFHIKHVNIYFGGIKCGERTLRYYKLWITTNYKLQKFI